jgi:flagellar basal body-associated protein FliL
MNKTAFLVLMLASLSAAVYTIDVDRSGRSSVTLSLQGNENATVPLPADARDFGIVGGSYNIVNGTAIVKSAQVGFTTFIYSSDLLAMKDETGWRLFVSPPEGTSVVIFMPAYSILTTSLPEPETVASSESRTEIEYGAVKNIDIEYRLGEVPPQKQDALIYIVAVAVVVVVALVILKNPMATRQQPQSQPAQTHPMPEQTPGKKPSLDMTPGKKEMMETFNENDVLIVNCLLDSNGKMRRNELERKTLISKSSLAMAINRLEKRKIIEIDRSATTHFVKLSENFLTL